MAASTHSTLSGWQFPGLTMFTQLREAVAVRRARNAARARLVAELNSYTDRELLDFGLARDDIPSVANGTYADRR